MAVIREACVPMGEQIRLINECSPSGMTDADWCCENRYRSNGVNGILLKCLSNKCRSLRRNRNFRKRRDCIGGAAKSEYIAELEKVEIVEESVNIRQRRAR